MAASLAGRITRAVRSWRHTDPMEEVSADEGARVQHGSPLRVDFRQSARDVPVPPWAIAARSVRMPPSPGRDLPRETNEQSLAGCRPVYLHLPGPRVQSGEALA